MRKNYDNIRRLIAYWQEYEENNPIQDFNDFGKWLDKKDTSDSSSSSTDINSGDELSHSKSQNEDELNNRQRFLDVIFRLSRLQDFYVKKLFEGIPLNNLLEFNFLFSLNRNISFKKKEIIDYNLVEYTTGIDIIKRLIKLQLVIEFTDQLDKRSKRLKITSEGKRVLIDALIVLNKIGYLFFDDRQHENWEVCMQNLTELVEYHRKIFIRCNSGTRYDILQVIKADDRYENSQK